MRIFHFAAALTAGLLLARPTHAQLPGSGGPSPDSPTTDVPLDGGASLLLAGGVAYGLRRLRSRRQADEGSPFTT